MRKILLLATSCRMLTIAAARPAGAGVLDKSALAAGPAASSAASGPSGSGPLLGHAPGSAAGHGAARTALTTPITGSGVVNINDASSEELQLLPGVGPSRADAIVAYRKSHPFKRVEELTRIKGIGRKSFVRLRALLTINGPTTLKEKPGKAAMPADAPLARSQRVSAPLNS